MGVSLEECVASGVPGEKRCHHGDSEKKKSPQRPQRSQRKQKIRRKRRKGKGKVRGKK